MKGLEEQIESQERNVEFMKKIVLHTSAIIISSSLLLKEIINFIGEEIKDNERQ